MVRHISKLVLGALLLLLVSCKPVDNHVLKIGANNWLGYQPLFVAQSHGLIDQTDINMVELGSATEVLRALYNGGLDAAALTLDEAITALDQNKKIKILLVMDFSFGGDTLIVSHTVSELSDLKGKTVAVESTALGAVMLDAILGKAELDVSDINILSVTYDEHESTLMKGKANALVTFEPARSRLLAKGYKELFSTRDIPGTIIDVLVINEDALLKYPQKVSSLVEAYFKARNILEEKQHDAMGSIAKRVGLTREAVTLSYELLKLPSLKENRALMASCSSGFNGAADKLVEVMLKRKMIDSEVSLSQACDNRFVNQLVL